MHIRKTASEFVIWLQLFSIQLKEKTILFLEDSK